MTYTFGNSTPKSRAGAKTFGWADGLAILIIFVLVYAGVRLAFHAPAVVKGPTISLQPSALVWYSLLSLARMSGAYLLSLLFTLFYGRAAAKNRRAERVMIPLLDVLQSVPILSFLPVVLLSLSAVLPIQTAAELASVILIFTSQAWNLTFSWYQSLNTIPKELREASSIFRLNTWLRFKKLELPFAMISLIWNSMMSWAGGWFFLMAAEIFTVGQRDFRLPGLGSYLHEASAQGNLSAIGWGIAVLILLVIALDQLVWRPLIAWSDRFKIEMIESDSPPTSWFYTLLRASWIGDRLDKRIFSPLSEKIDIWLLSAAPVESQDRSNAGLQKWLRRVVLALLAAGLAYGLLQGLQLLTTIPAGDWAKIGLGLLATALRVAVSLLIALAWTIPAGVLIGTNPRAAAVLQPVVQITASVPATALFPVLLLLILRLPGGLDLAAVLLMLLGTQWYLLFNIIAGANAIPQDLKYTASLLGLNRFERWKTLILPSLFPYLVTGAITASGGAWNASIVAEFVTFSGRNYQTTGIGSLIAQSTADGNYPLLLASTLSMILAVVLINRLVWRPLYQLAEDSYRME